MIDRIWESSWAHVQAASVLKKHNDSHPGKGFASNKLRELILEVIKQAQIRPDWKSIESAPKDGSTILLFYPRLIVKIHFGIWSDYKTVLNEIETYSSKGWDAGFTVLPPNLIKSEDYEPTHWAPMISGPDE